MNKLHALRVPGRFPLPQTPNIAYRKTAAIPERRLASISTHAFRITEEPAHHTTTGTFDLEEGGTKQHP